MSEKDTMKEIRNNSDDQISGLTYLDSVYKYLINFENSGQD